MLCNSVCHVFTCYLTPNGMSYVYVYITACHMYMSIYPCIYICMYCIFVYICIVYCILYMLYDKDEGLGPIPLLINYIIIIIITFL